MGLAADVGLEREPFRKPIQDHIFLKERREVQGCESRSVISKDGVRSPVRAISPARSEKECPSQVETFDTCLRCSSRVKINLDCNFTVLLSTSAKAATVSQSICASFPFVEERTRLSVNVGEKMM